MAVLQLCAGPDRWGELEELLSLLPESEAECARSGGGW